MVGRRERYHLEGPDRFGDAELIALVIGVGSGGRSALEIAATLLDRFGGLAGLARQEPAELRSVTGVGAERAVRIHAALQAGRRSQIPATWPDDPVQTPVQAWQILEPSLRGRVDEELHALFLDRRRRPVGHRGLTRGCDGSTVVDPRQVFRVAVRLGASGVILAHNHPSGDPTPSPQDIAITDRVASAGQVLGIGLLDHLVIGAGTFCSLAQIGVLPPWQPPERLWVESDVPSGSSSSRSVDFSDIGSHLRDIHRACGQSSSRPRRPWEPCR